MVSIPFSAAIRITRKISPSGKAQAVVVRAEYLERGNTFRDQARDLGHDLFVQVGDIHVKAEIDGRACIRLGMPGVHIGDERRDLLRYKIDHRGGAAKGSRFVPGVVIVRRNDRAQHGQVEMGMHIHAAGQHQLPGRIDHLRVLRGGKMLANGSNGLTFNENIRLKRFGRGNQSSRFY